MSPICYDTTRAEKVKLLNGQLYGSRSKMGWFKNHYVYLEKNFTKIAIFGYNKGSFLIFIFVFHKGLAKVAQGWNKNLFLMKIINKVYT